MPLLAADQGAATLPNDSSRLSRPAVSTWCRCVPLRGRTKAAVAERRAIASLLRATGELIRGFGTRGSAGTGSLLLPIRHQCIRGENIMRRLATAIFILLGLVILSCEWIGTTPALAYDADTLTIDDKRYRLDGIDAPEIDQICLDSRGQPYPCGRWALEAIDALAAGRPTVCQDLGADPAHPKRRIGQCHIGKTYLNRWLVQQGWAINFEPYAKGRFQFDEAQARASQLGLWQGCFVRPRDFRRWNKHRAELLGPRCPPDAREKLFPAHAQMPEGCEVKAKYALRALPYQGIYHLPGCGSYLRTKKPDRWFCSEQEALEAGFRSSFTCWLR